MISKWFEDDQFAMALSIAVGFSMAGSSVNSILSPTFLEIFNDNLTGPLFVGLLVCILSFTCALILNILDKRADKQEERFVFIKKY
jgi:hypothetical protein